LDLFEPVRRISGGASMPARRSLVLHANNLAQTDIDAKSGPRGGKSATHSLQESAPIDRNQSNHGFTRMKTGRRTPRSALPPFDSVGQRCCFAQTSFPPCLLFVKQHSGLRSLATAPHLHVPKIKWHFSELADNYG
jgi:hypothetical protein